MDPLVWPAHWISLSAHPQDDLGVFGFRVKLDLSEVPKTLPIHVSADQRYKLYVNGEMVIFGPQRGDEKHWFYETVDLAPFLREGENWISAFVWNFGRWAPMAQHTVRTGFVFCLAPPPLAGMDRAREEEGAGGGGQDFSDVLNTPGEWQVMRIPGWDFEMMHSNIGEFYIDVGPGEIIDGRTYPWGWDRGSSPPTPVGMVRAPEEEGAGGWRSPNVICQAEERGASGGGTPWMLIPRSIPLMNYEARPAPPAVRTGFVGDQLAAMFSEHGSPFGKLGPNALKCNLRLAPGQSILLDFGEVICAFPKPLIGGPAGAVVTVTYAESLWQADNSKGDRNDVTDKEVRGYQDKFVVDGEVHSYEPLWWRTFRYLKLECDPEYVVPPGWNPPLLYEVHAIETGYPLQVESSFTADDPWVERIWDVSIRTAKRCAGETYFDCPYYEQLQYVGDTRIQALIGYYLGHDRALQRNAVETLGWSIMDNGLTQSRYPSRQAQVIPPFSLWWVMMLHDQMLYDSANRDSVSKVDKIIIAWLRNGPGFWNFADWVSDWRMGVPPGDAKSTLHQLTLMLAWQAWQKLVSQNADGASKLPSHLSTESWVDAISSFARAPTDPSWRPSEHAEAILRNLRQLECGDSNPWPTEALAAAAAAKCTYYFSYYKHLAMFGRPEENPQSTIHNPQSDYLTELQPWKEMIENGLTTFAENPEPTRSDCHAWSAHPILGFFQIVAGVTSIAPGWKKARIMPHPGDLKRFDARIAHPDGELRVAYENEKFTIDSPVPFEFRWRDKNGEFKEGRHEIG